MLASKRGRFAAAGCRNTAIPPARAPRALEETPRDAQNPRRAYCCLSAQAAQAPRFSAPWWYFRQKRWKSALDDDRNTPCCRGRQLLAMLQKPVTKIGPTPASKPSPWGQAAVPDEGGALCPLSGRRGADPTTTHKQEKDITMGENKAKNMVRVAGAACGTKRLRLCNKAGFGNNQLTWNTPRINGRLLDLPPRTPSAALY